MIRKFCRVFCLVFLIGDFQTSLSQHDYKMINLSKPIANNSTLAHLDDAWHQASIRLIEKDVIFGEGHICSGSLISSRVVLTAARCLFNASSKTQRHPAELIVVMGAINRYQRTVDTVTSKIAHIRYPESFDMETMHDDVAMLFLNNEVSEHHPTIRPIEITRIKHVVSETRGSVTSWHGDASSQLMISNASIVQPDNCISSFEQSRMTDAMICVKHSKLSDICHFDAGAPFVIDRKLAGLASWTVEDCVVERNEQFAVYTNVVYHKEWIRRELSDESNTDSSLWGLLGFLTFTWFAFRDQKKIDFRF